MNDENNVVRYLRQRNEKALEYVIDQYGGLIKSIVNKHLYNLQSQREECMNDILLAIWNGIEGFDGELNTFKNWIAAISKYKSIDYKRKYMKLLLEQGLGNNDVGQTVHLEEEALKNELNYEIESILSQLSLVDRKLFLAHYVEDKGIDDLASEMKVKPSAIYNKLSRSRKKLRSLLGNK